MSRQATDEQGVGRIRVGQKVQFKEKRIYYQIPVLGRVQTVHQVCLLGLQGRKNIQWVSSQQAEQQLRLVDAQGKAWTMVYNLPRHITALLAFFSVSPPR